MAKIITPYYGSNSTVSGQNNTVTNTLGSYNTTIGSSGLGIYGTSFNTTISKTKYHILGEDVEVAEAYEYYEPSSLAEASEDMRGVYLYEFMEVLTRVNGEEWATNYKQEVES